MYTEGDADFEEAKEAGESFVSCSMNMLMALPLYKIFPTKIYRTYVSNVSRMQKIGRKILKKKYSDLKDVIEAGSIDESKVAGELNGKSYELKLSMA